MAYPTPLLEKVRNTYPSLSLSPIDKFRDGILRTSWRWERPGKRLPLTCDEQEILTVIAIFFSGGCGVEEESVCCSGGARGFLSQNAYDGDLWGQCNSYVSGMWGHYRSSRLLVQRIYMYTCT